MVEPKSTVKADCIYAVHESIPYAVGTKTCTIDTKVGTIGTKTGTVGTKVGTIGTKTGTVGTIGTKVGTVGAKTGTIGTKVGTIGAKVGTVDAKDDADLGNLNIEKTAVEKLLCVIRENEAITQKQMSEKTGLSLRTIKRMTTELQRTGKIIRIGNSRSGKWLVKE